MAVAVVGVDRSEAALKGRDVGLQVFGAVEKVGRTLSGALSASQISVARRLGKPKYEPIMTETEEALVAVLSELDIHSTERAVDHWAKRADALIDEKAPPVERPNELTYSNTMDDVTHGTFRLNEAAGTEFDKAVQTAITHAGNDETRTSAERQGDALFDIAAFFNKNHDGNERPRNLPNVTLSADASTVVTDHPEGVNVDTQRPMSSACTDTYLCDCRIHVILRTADGSPHSFGRTTRTVLPRTGLRPTSQMDRRTPHRPLVTRRHNLVNYQYAP